MTMPADALDGEALANTPRMPDAASAAILADAQTLAAASPQAAAWRPAAVLE